MASADGKDADGKDKVGLSHPTTGSATSPQPGRCRVLLKKLRVKRRVTEKPVSRYRPETQTAQVLENGVWKDSWKARDGLTTKKADIETGEDQKGA